MLLKAFQLFLPDSIVLLYSRIIPLITAVHSSRAAYVMQKQKLSSPSLLVLH